MKTQDTLDEQAMALIKKTKMRIAINYPFYGALLERLKLRVDHRAKTLYTDGKVIGFDPAYVMQKPMQSLTYIVLHEVSHCALGHPFRLRNKEDREIANQAADHCVNLILNRDKNLVMPSGGLADPRFEGMHFDAVYRILMAEKAAQEQEQQSQQDGAGPSQQSMGGSNAAEEGEGEQQSLGTGTDEGDIVAPGEAGDFEDEEDDSPFAKGDQPKVKGDDDEAQDEKDKRSGKGKEARPGTEKGREEGKDADDAGSGDEDGAPGEGGEDGEGSEGRGGEEGSGQSGNETSEDDGDGEGSGGGAGSPADTEGRADHQQESAGQGSTAGDEAEDEALAREWQGALATAALAAGDHVSKAIERRMREASSKRQSFEEVLELFCTQRVKEVDDWGRRNRRFNDVYLPSRGGVGAQVILFGIDTSASIDTEVLGKMQDAMARIAEQAHVERSIVVYCDSAVRGVEEYQGEPPRFQKVRGGGGTRFGPVFQYAVERIEQGDDIVGVVYITDQLGSVSQYEDYEHIPTLWVNPGPVRPAEFGIVCSMLD